MKLIYFKYFPLVYFFILVKEKSNKSAVIRIHKKQAGGKNLILTTPTIIDVQKIKNENSKIKNKKRILSLFKLSFSNIGTNLNNKAKMVPIKNGQKIIGNISDIFLKLHRYPKEVVQ